MNILQNCAEAPKQVILHSHRDTKENVSEFLESLNKEQTVSPKIIRVGKELPMRIITDEKVFTKENTALEIKTRKH